MINIISTPGDQDANKPGDKKEDIFQELKKDTNKAKSDIDVLIKSTFGEYVDFQILDQDALEMSFVDSSKNRHVFYEVDATGNIKEIHITLHVIPYSNILSASEEELAQGTPMIDIKNNLSDCALYLIHKEILKDDLANGETQDGDESVTAYKIENSISAKKGSDPVTIQEISERLHNRLDADKYINDQFKM